MFPPHWPGGTALTAAFPRSPYLFAEGGSPRALRLPVALGQHSVAVAQPLAGGVVDRHGVALGGALLGEAFDVG